MTNMSFKKTLTDKMPFGKYKGSFFEDILENDPSYMQWLIDKDIIDFNEADLAAIIEELG